MFLETRFPIVALSQTIATQHSERRFFASKCSQSLCGSILSVVTLLLLILALSVSVSSVQAAEPPVRTGTEDDPSAGQTIQEIEVTGLVRTDIATVLNLIRTRKGRPFDRKVWGEDYHRLIDSSPHFINVQIREPIPCAGGITLVIDVIEKASVTKIAFKGNKALAAGKLLAIIKTYEGGRFDKGQVHEDKTLLEKHYQERAFRSIHVEYEIEVISSHRQVIGGKEVDVEDEVRVVFTVDEGSPVGVRSIRFEGNHAFNDNQLRAAMGTKYRRLFRAGDLKDDELDIDKRRLEAHYRRAGFMDIEIQQMDVNLSKETYFNWFKKRKRLADILIKINEGGKYFVGTMSIVGNISIDKDEIEAVMKLKPDSVFSDLLVSDDQERIKDLYGERGRVFTLARADYKLVQDPERTKLKPNLYDVEFMIKESPEVTLRLVLPRGNNKTKDAVIIRQLELFPGERIDTTKIKIALARLKNLGYFNPDLTIKPEPTDNPEEADLVIDVTEKNTGEFNFGAGISSADGVIGNISLKQHNFDYKDFPKSWRDLIGGNAFVGGGQDASIDISGGAKRQNYSISFFEPWAFGRPIRMGGSIFRSVDNSAKDFNQTNTGFSTTIGRRLWGPRWDGDVSYRFSYTQLTGTNRRYPPILQQQEGDRILSSISPRLVYDSRDSRLFPTRGFLAEASLEIGGGPMFGDYDWVKPRMDLARYLTMYKLKNGQKHVLELRTRASLIEAYGNTDDIPPFMRFYAGGVDTIRGFQSRTITPLENNFQIGGKKLFLASAEYSLPLYEDIVRASAFVDSGSVWDAGNTDFRTQVSNESGYRASMGLGLSIKTPLSPSPIRLYFARPILKNDDDQTKIFDFSFARQF